MLKNENKSRNSRYIIIIIIVIATVIGMLINFFDFKLGPSPIDKVQSNAGAASNPKIYEKNVR